LGLSTVVAVSVEQIKNGIAALSPAEQSEISAFLFHLRHTSDPEYQRRVEERLNDANPLHWVSPEEFERRLDEK